MFCPYVSYSLSGQLNRKKVLWNKKKPNIPGAEGDKEANSQYHKNCREWLF